VPINAMPCQLLDDYLNNDLTGEDLARFQSHLEGCSACSRALGEHQQLRALLCEAVAREPLPVGLGEKTVCKLRAARLRWIAVLWWFGQAGTKPNEPMIAREAPRAVPQPAEKAPNQDVHVTFLDNPSVLAVPEKMDSPNITFYWVYPGYATKTPYSTTERDDQ
jgi:anti-sigma factor RsiW